MIAAQPHHAILWHAESSFKPDIHAHLLPCSFIQAAAAAQAGVSVIQPNIGDSCRLNINAVLSKAVSCCFVKGAL